MFPCTNQISSFFSSLHFRFPFFRFLLGDFDLEEEDNLVFRFLDFLDVLGEEFGSKARAEEIVPDFLGVFVEEFGGPEARAEEMVPDFLDLFAEDFDPEVVRDFLYVFVKKFSPEAGAGGIVFGFSLDAGGFSSGRSMARGFSSSRLMA